MNLFVETPFKKWHEWEGKTNDPEQKNMLCNVLRKVVEGGDKWEDFYLTLPVIYLNILPEKTFDADLYTLKM